MKCRAGVIFFLYSRRRFLLPLSPFVFLFLVLGWHCVVFYSIVYEINTLLFFCPYVLVLLLLLLHTLLWVLPLFSEVAEGEENIYTYP